MVLFNMGKKAAKTSAYENGQSLIRDLAIQQERFKHCDLVKLAVGGSDTSVVYVPAYGVDTICNPNFNQVIDFAKSMFTHLTNLALADCEDGSRDEGNICTKGHNRQS